MMPRGKLNRQANSIELLAYGHREGTQVNPEGHGKAGKTDPL
jgi:hypothetical protein